MVKKLNTYIPSKKITSPDKYITEKLKIGKMHYTCQPKTSDELCRIIEERLADDKDADLNDIDVSEITDMRKLFYNLDPHEIDISRWDVSNVEDMSYMFSGFANGCENFNCDLGDWDVSNVTNMDSMFYNCKNFKGEGLENWKVSNNTIMKYMFDNCDSLKNKPSWYRE